MSTPGVPQTVEGWSALLASIVDASDDAIMAKTPDGIIISWNHGAEVIYGYSADEIIGKPVSVLTHPDRPKEMDEILHHIRGGGRVAHYEALRVCKDGSEIWVSITVSPILDSAGNLIGVSSTARDVTAKAQASQYARSLIEASLDPLVTISAEGKITDVNEASVKVTGFPREKLIGADFSDYFTDPDQARLGYQQAFSEGSVTDYPLTIRHKDGRLTEVLYNASVYKDSRGAVLGVFAAARDVTERQEAETELELARLEADRANHAKSDFLSRMSHELRTPLNAVLGFGQLLELDELNTAQRDSVEHITKAGRHLLGLINEVLDISRVESGELRLSLESVSLRDVVGAAVGMVRPLAAARVVRIDDLVAGGEEYVRADLQRLKQVVVNLLANAVKYNREGGEVSVVCEAVSDGRVRLVVADTGIGIAECDLARLFLPFERLGAEQSDVEGTGLGLTLAKHLVKAMGGEVGATSQAGVGSSFWVELPLTDAPRERPADLLPLPVAPAPISARARTVLYVEDNLSNVKLVERIMARRPEITLVVAMQGRLALDLAREHQPSLILLDLHLPDVSGEEVLQGLRADPRTSATPVVVLSADATPGQVQRLRAQGATDYLTKPFDIPRLLALIDVDGSGEQPSTAREIPSGTAGSGPLDPMIVASLHDLGRDVEAGNAGMRDAVTTFIDNSESLFADLRVAVLDGDIADVERIAHSLAGSAASFGARNVAEGCREVDARARASDLGGVPMLVAGLDDAFTVARAALRAEFLEGADRGIAAAPPEDV
nr:PAS domain S-box protein [Aeromicrobium sp.]